MAIAAVIITFARLKTKGIIKFTLSFVSFILLVFGFLCGLIAIV